MSYIPEKLSPEVIALNSLEVNYPEFIDNVDIIGFGEEHQREGTKLEVAQNMELFAKLGFTHFGIEMLGDDPEILQAIEAFEGSADDQVAQENFEILISHIMSPDRFGPYTDFADNAYRELLQSAKKAGLKIVPLGLPTSIRDDYRLLDQNMATRMKDAMQSLGQRSRGIIFAGSAHIVNTPNSALGILRQGFKTMSFLLAGSADNGRSIESHAKLAGKSNKRFAIRSKEYNTDYIIHLPQTESPALGEIKQKGPRFGLS